MRRISRKEFLGIGVAAGAVLAGSGLRILSPRNGGHAHHVAYAQTQVPLTPFQDALPIPQVLNGANPVNLSMTQFGQQLHSALPPTQVWGYGGTYPGPTIKAVKGTPTTVSYSNNLPANHLFKVDPTIIQMRGKNAKDTRILTHLHGGHISDIADGNPYASPDLMVGQTQTVTYANDQEATHLWYHEHAMGITRLNVMAGLAGNYLLRDAVDDGQGGNFPEEPGTGLPFGAYEVPLTIQDRAFTKKGQFDYPANWTPEFFGDTVLVNGKVWPFHNVEPRKYRFRVLNGSNSRFYRLQLSNGQPMIQIGTDGGLLPEPVQINSLLLAPAERADIIIDFSTMNGNVELIDIPLPATTVSPGPPLPQPQIVQFRVGGQVAVSDKPLPQNLGGSVSVPGPVAQTRFMTLEEQLAGPVPTAVVLNGLNFADPVTETPAAGTIEDWWLINISADTHPIHVHLVQFEIVERRVLDVAGYQAALDAARAQAGGPVNAAGQLVNPDPSLFLGANEPVDPNEQGLKDTVRANPMQATRIRAHFDLPAGDQPPARYVWHCHILEHEDNDMMRPFEVR